MLKPFLSRVGTLTTRDIDIAILVLPSSNIFTKFRQGHPVRGTKQRRVMKMLQFSTNIFQQ